LAPLPRSDARRDEPKLWIPFHAEQEGKMNDLRETTQAALGGLEALVSKIPGYKGYKDKELRREADKLLRMQVASKFDEQRKRMSEIQMQFISQSQVEFLDDLERAIAKLQLLVDRLRTASYGYAGLFDAVKVKEEQLDVLYEFDNKMVNFGDEIASGVDKVASAVSAQEGIGPAIADLVHTADEANSTYGHRAEAILQAAA
jgi:hypothetical protein